MKRIATIAILSMFVFLLAGCGLFNQSGTITGVITDQNGDPASGVTVVVGDASITSGTNGGYSLEVKAGDYTLSAESDVYGTYTANVVITKKEETVHNFEMTKPYVEGYVTDGRGGPAVEGATVNVEGSDLSTTTDANGYFMLYVQPGEEVDLIVQQETRASTRVQDLYVAAGQIMEIEVPTRALFNPDWTSVPPTIEFSVNRGDELSGTETVNLSVDGDVETFVFYVYLDGQQRYPYEGFAVDSNTGSFDIDTTLYPNGETYFRILAYDNNENGVLTYIPVTINNEADDESAVGDIPVCNVETTTFGYNIGMYAEQRKAYFEENGIEGNPYIIETPKGSFDLQSAPENAMILTRITWDPAENADGYHVYRSFDGENYKLLGNVTEGRYDDFGSALAENKATYYQVVPYNSLGEGNPVDRMTMPLPAHTVYLETPANDTTDVALAPTFTWRNEFSAEPAVTGLVYQATIDIWDANDYQIFRANPYDLAEVTEYTLPGALDPNGVYSWDISASIAVGLLYDDVDGYVQILSAAGEYTSEGTGTGSINGEFIFRTTTDTNL